MNSPVVLITGALTGIDRAAAIIFAQQEAQQGQGLAAEMQALGAEAILVSTNVGDDDEVRKLAEQMVEL